MHRTRSWLRHVKIYLDAGTQNVGTCGIPDDVCVLSGSATLVLVTSVLEVATVGMVVTEPARRFIDTRIYQVEAYYQ
jgi:hypothetical protein